MDNLTEIEKSIIYIENNLHKHITLDELASMAFRSKFHYHRAFKAIMGEPVMEYIRKRRLKWAALLLLKTNKCVKTIAFECGFDFHQSFTRAFKKQYGISPDEYRNNKRIFITCEKLDFDGRKLFIEKPLALSEPSFVEESDLKFVGVKCLTNLNENSKQRVISKLWGEFAFRMAEIKNRIDNNAVFGIGFYNSTPHLGYAACVRVEKIECVPMGMESKVLPPTKYLKFTHKGIDIDVADSLDYIFGKWLIDQEYKLSGEIDFIIRMDERFTGKNDSEMDIYIPIKQMGGN